MTDVAKTKSKESKQLFVMIVNAITNILLSVAKILVGFLYNSQLLIADGIHSASDLLTDFFSIIGLQFAKKPRDEAHPFGHGNLEYASSLTVSILIFFMVYGLIVELYQSWSILPTQVSLFVLAVSFATCIIKLFLSVYVLYQAEKLDSHTLRSSGTESKADAYSTVVVILGLLLTYAGIKHGITWLLYAEKLATVVVILMLTKAAWEIFFQSIVGIAGTYAPKEVQQNILQRVTEHIQDKALHFTVEELVAMKYGLDYGVLLTLVFTEEIPLQQASEEMQDLREFLYADKRIKKVTMEFTVLAPPKA